MSKITIMQGLPASGKTTKAEELLKIGNTVRINKDLLRTMLHFNKWTGKNEGLTKGAARTLAGMFLQSGTNVIIDDTNLNEGTVQSWKDLAKIHNAKIEYVRMDTSIEECLKRDAVRDKKVGESVIVGMALSANFYPKPEKGIVICDLDGTLCDLSKRIHFVNGDTKDWKSFFAGIPDDEPRMEVMDMVLTFEGEGYEIFFVSGRPEKFREQTETWLEKHFKGYKIYKSLFMRRDGDSRQDTEVKQGILNSVFKEKSWIHRVIDDRPSVIRMWKEEGLNVIDVGSGVEF